MVRRAQLRSVGLGVLAYFGFSFPVLAKDYIVKTRHNLGEFTNKVFFKGQSGLRIIDSHAKGQLLLVKNLNTSKSETEVLSTLSSDLDVEYVVENIKLHAFANTNDPEFGKQWALAKINAEKAWDLSKGRRDVVVAVIDTGVDWKHEDLKAQIWNNTKEIPGNNIDDDKNGFVDDQRGWDFRNNDNDPLDETSDRNPGHGTHCAGIIGAQGNNGVGISGIAQTVSIMPVRFLGSDGSGDLMTAAKAIDYAIGNKANVISASWGAPVTRAQVKPILEAIDRAEAAGVVFVAAAANDGKSNDSREVYPANAGNLNVISVAASNPEDKKPNWSNFGKNKVDLSSPGEGIFSTLPNNTYNNLSGTSMATPLVAGLVALVISKSFEANKKLTPSEIKAILQASGTDADIETACHCRVDAYAALAHLADRRLTVVPNAASLELNQEGALSGFGGKGPYTFKSDHDDILSVSADGKMKGLARGEAVITVQDSAGATAVSKKIYVDDKGGGGGGNEQCPFKDPMMCELMCQIMPQMPWCNSLTFLGY